MSEKELTDQEDAFITGLKTYKEIMATDLDVEATYTVVNDYLDKIPTPKQAIEKLPKVLEQLRKSSREQLTAKTIEAAYENLTTAINSLESEEGKSAIENGLIIYESLRVSVAMINCFKDSILGDFTGYRPY